MTFHARPDKTAEWLAYLRPEGLVVGANVLRAHTLTPLRQTPLDTEEAAAALGLASDAERADDASFVLREPWRLFSAILGWRPKDVAGAPDGPAIDAALSRTVPEHETLLSPDMAVLWPGEPEKDVPAQALVMLRPELDADARNQFAGEWEASPHQRLERLVRETGVGVGILVARNALRLIYAPRGETAGWLTWPLAALGRVEGRPMLAGLKLCLGRPPSSAALARRGCGRCSRPRASRRTKCRKSFPARCSARCTSCCAAFIVRRPSGSRRSPRATRITSTKAC